MVNIHSLNRGQKVLLISNANVLPEVIQEITSELSKIVTNEGEVKVENIERLESGDVKDKSCYDVILSGTLSPYSITHDIDTLSHYLNLVKPKGRIIVQEIVKTGESNLRTEEELLSSMKIAGIVEILAGEVIEIKEADKKNISTILGNDLFTLVKYEGKKPEFEIGSSVKISLPVPQSVANVWKLDDGFEDDDLIDDAELIKDEDVGNTDFEPLKKCGTTGKRKACKNCSCGLADELAAQSGDSNKQPSNLPKSSCGNCYLGDAFRCAGCPYLGMPAFKPGEKITLTEAQMKADI